MRGGGCSGSMFKCTARDAPSEKVEECTECKMNFGSDPGAGATVQCGEKSFPTFLGRPDFK